MNDRFEVQWRLNEFDKWEPQEGGFASRRSANDFIASQPEGGMYRVVVEERGMNPAYEGIYAAREDDRRRKLEAVSQEIAKAADAMNEMHARRFTRRLAEPDALEIEREKERVFGTCGGKCGEAPCVEWNKAHRTQRRLRNEPLALTFDVEHPGELQAGLRAYSDTVTVTVDSGDPGGSPDEFTEEMQKFLLGWFDGAAVGLRPANLPKNAYPVARKGKIEYVTIPED